jgi:hypothetical protein
VLGIVFILIRLAVTIEPLSAASGASFDVASLDMELGLDDATIVARTTFGAPIFCFVTVADARNLFSLDNTGSKLLGCLNFLWPPFDH